MGEEPDAKGDEAELAQPCTAGRSEDAQGACAESLFPICESGRVIMSVAELMLSHSNGPPRGMCCITTRFPKTSACM